ncbi:MAG TPA: hypothetical protein VEK33_21045 [Terriglobales bacterium]|nr:hypothetical protein [Terriglobales bacterium]
MPRMIDAVRKSQLPSNMMQFAARGALLVPPEEMLEILVYLAKHNSVFGPQAKLTLAGWNERSCREILANPATPKEVLDYFTDPDNLRPGLLPALLDNRSVGDEFLVRQATHATAEQAGILLASERVGGIRSVLEVLSRNQSLTPALMARVQEKLSVLGSAEPSSGLAQAASGGTASQEAESRTGALSETAEGDSSEAPEDVLERFMAEHAGEIAEEAGKEFVPVDDGVEPRASEAVALAAQAAAATASAGGQPEATRERKPPMEQKKWILSAEEQRGSALQKIAKLDIKGRILLAIKGTREERSLLIRDGTKIVALAVLESPKVTESEVERFANQRNVLDAVLRAITMKRRFMKQYAIVKNLTFNPRTPIDVSLGLLKNLLLQDLRHLAGNKEVAETVRKLADKMVRQKLSAIAKS